MKLKGLIEILCTTKRFSDFKKITYQLNQLVIKNREGFKQQFCGFDGKRLNPRKADLQEWREGFADAMRLQGVEAEATPRRSRGVVKKAEKAAIRHIASGNKSRVSRVRVAKQQEALHELAAEAKNQPVDVQPWDVSIKATQTAIREKWVAVANDLEKTASPDSKALAGRINGFVIEMPAMETERHQIKRELRQVASQDKTHHKNKEIER